MLKALGFEKQREYFRTVAATGSLAHGYLFSGPDMIGKRTFALELSEMLGGKTGDSRTFMRVLAPVTEKGKQKGIPIEAVRELRGFMSLKSPPGTYKITIVDGAERLTEAAANAFLKLLEEPPSGSLFIFITARPDDVLPTVLSRLVNVKFLTHAPEIMEKFISGHHLSRSDAETLLLLADGRIGWAANILNENKLPDIKGRIDEFQAILRQGIASRVMYAKRLADSDDYRDTVVAWMRWIRAFGKNPEKTRTALSRLLKLYAIIDQPQFNHRLALENFLINI